MIHFLKTFNRNIIIKNDNNYIIKPIKASVDIGIIPVRNGRDDLLKEIVVKMTMMR